MLRWNQRARRRIAPKCIQGETKLDRRWKEKSLDKHHFSYIHIFRELVSTISDFSFCDGRTNENPRCFIQRMIYFRILYVALIYTCVSILSIPRLFFFLYKRTAVAAGFKKDSIHFGLAAAVAYSSPTWFQSLAILHSFVYYFNYIFSSWWLTIYMETFSSIMEDDLCERSTDLLFSSKIVKLKKKRLHVFWKYSTWMSWQWIERPKERKVITLLLS